jgi:hypothetical protein
MARRLLMIIAFALATLAASANLGTVYAWGNGPGWHGGWGGPRGCCWRGGGWGRSHPGGWGHPGWGWHAGWGWSHPPWGGAPGWGWRMGWVWVPGWGWTWR